MARDNKLYSGFVLHDYILTFSIASPAPERTEGSVMAVES